MLKQYYISALQSQLIQHYLAIGQTVGEQAVQGCQKFISCFSELIMFCNKKNCILHPFSSYTPLVPKVCII